MGVTWRDPRTDPGASRVEQDQIWGLLVAAQDGGDLSPGDAGFAGPGHCRRDVLVDEISGRVTGTSQLIEVGQGHGVENIEIVCAKCHGQIFAPTLRPRDPGVSAVSELAKAEVARSRPDMIERWIDVKRTEEVAHVQLCPTRTNSSSMTTSEWQLFDRVISVKFALISAFASVCTPSPVRGSILKSLKSGVDWLPSASVGSRRR